MPALLQQSLSKTDYLALFSQLGEMNSNLFKIVAISGEPRAIMEDRQERKMPVPKEFRKTSSHIVAIHSLF
jgi:hypothetical protein